MISSLVLKSLGKRKFTTFLTILSIGLSVALLLGIERLKTSAKDSFMQTISDVDLVVGARSGQIPLLLSTVFHIGNAANNIEYSSYEEIIEEPSVAWSIPFSMGDGHKGYRVIGTTDDFYNRYKFRRDKSVELAKGKKPAGIHDVTIGAIVARTLGYDIGHKIILEHGITDGETSFHKHEDSPFTVTGILAPTGTPVDRALYVTLEGIEAIHEGWEDGAPPMEGEQKGHEAHAGHDHHDHDHGSGQITSFLLRTNNRIDTLNLQRLINEYVDEPLSAVIPGLALSELWTAIGYGETVLIIISIFVVIVGLIGMAISIYNSLNERRREMAVLRSLGAGPGTILGIMMMESVLLTMFGILAGIVVTYGTMFLVQPVISTEFGIHLSISTPTIAEMWYCLIVLVLGAVYGFIPALQAYRNTVNDGLQIRV